MRDAIVVDAIIRNARRETVLESGCARRQVSAEAYAVKRNLPRIYVFTRQYIVHHRCDDLFPVRPEMEPLSVNGSELTGTVEYQHIEAAFDRSTRAQPVHFLCGPVEAVVQHKRGTRHTRIVDLMEIAWQRRPFVGNFHGFDCGREKSPGCLVASDGALVSALDARIIWIGVQEKLGAAIVAAGSQIIVPGADLVALPELTGGFIGEAIGESVVGIVPTVVITGLDVFGDSDVSDQGIA